MSLIFLAGGRLKMAKIRAVHCKAMSAAVANEVRQMLKPAYDAG